MKKPKAVAAAEAAYEAKRAEVAAAKEAVRSLEAQQVAAYAACHQARVDADAALPQCSAVEISSYGGKEKDIGRFVILRRTPGGILVARCVGESDECARKFKWAKWAGDFREVRKSSVCRHSTTVLRDVPSEFMPASEVKP